jgi:acyl-homoserine lactone acylase PvdQ
MAHLPGPHGPIRFERRAYGYPHIEARDVFEGVFARGYLHAVDRLVQVSLSRAVAAGRAMELMGDKPLARSISLGRPDLSDAPRLQSILARAWPEARRRVREGRWPLPLRRGFVNTLLGGRLPRALGWDGPPLDLPGGPTSLFQTRTVEVEGETFLGGPAFHLLFDLGEPGGWFNICGGASESRFGPGYGEGVDDWVAGRFAPLGPARGPAPSARR